MKASAKRFGDEIIGRCGSDALARYLFLITVAGAEGLSDYSDQAVVRRSMPVGSGKPGVNSCKPDWLLIDEFGYPPLDKSGADLLFQIISHRYERGAILLTSNRIFKNWPAIFNNDSTITATVLDRLLHPAETVIIEGKSDRMKDQIDTPRPIRIRT